LSTQERQSRLESFAAPSDGDTTLLNELLEKVRRELIRYEHPLFAFDARAAAQGVEVEIRFKTAGVDLHPYQFLLQPREIENKQFPWTFQRQLYDCLHDYIVEMFTCNPQREDA
jgi:hypothetical protein